MHNRYVILTCVIGCLFTLAINGCGSDSDDQTDEPINSLPMVRRLILPDAFAPRETIELEIIAHDPDDDPLSYTWHVTAGKLDSTTGAKVKWTAPADVRSITITVRVNDSPTSSITRSKTVNYVSDHPPEVQLTRIVPGKQAIGIKLGDPFDTAKALYGKQDDPISKDGFFSYWDNNIGLSGFVNDSNNVRSLFIRKPNKSKTDSGTGIRSSLRQVEDEFGPAEKIDAPDKTHWYWTKGIAFSYDADLRVESIHVFNPIGAAPPKIMPMLNLKQLQKLEKIAVDRKLHRKTNTLSR